MSTRLVLLGLLRRGPLHGYELKHIIEEHMGDWTNIAFGSIYFALGKLRDEGFVEEAEAERSGRRPAKIVYGITEDGRAEFMRLLRETFRDRRRQYYEIDTGLAFLDALDPGEAVACFKERLAELEEAESGLRRHEKEQMSRPEVPASARAIFSHGMAHLRAERMWTAAVLSGLESGAIGGGAR